jgi:predicted transcriptional regulator
MRDTITQQLDDKDNECVNLLRKIGFGMCVAKVTVALIFGSKTQRELSLCIDENQSSVSIALRRLREKNLVDVSGKIPQGRKGRPHQKYTLISWDTVIDTIEKETIQKHETKKAQINRLKELIN